MGTDSQKTTLEQTVFLYIPQLLPEIRDGFIEDVSTNIFDWGYKDLNKERRILQDNNPHLYKLIGQIKEVISKTEYQKMVIERTSLIFHQALRTQAMGNRLEWLMANGFMSPRLLNEETYLLPMVPEYSVTEFINEGMLLRNTDERSEYVRTQMKWFNENKPYQSYVKLLEKLISYAKINDLTRINNLNTEFTSDDAVIVSGVAFLMCLLNKSISNYIASVFPRPNCNS